MAFDKPTRNRLAAFVGEARNLISGEFTQQFQSLYGISEKGEVTPLDQLRDLDEAELATAATLRERIDYLVKSHPDHRDVQRAAVDRLTREQAFTILNRLAAIRMAEKRGIIVESVGKGYQSQGFKVYEQVAGTGLGDTYRRYRRYLFCLFDELAVDLGVLFDRRSPQGLLFPREPALLQLFEILNAPDLDALWSEDETIGWIYQYYNDPAERKKMREASSAPRNSRELAVRNQFFTPRYVVEFLTDNTLGRIWYEMTQGQTRLKEQCRYLVRRSSEIFLKPDESAPDQREQDDFSQEELLKQPVYIPHRPIKDPRETRMLDPACGSMHFGLYAFDLFEVIYEEAWDLGIESLRCDYPNREELIQEIPRLIIEHNIHGIDIDPRAVQIAGLSLWMRAQRAWQQQKLRPEGRPRILRSNIVCAGAMPGDKTSLNEFINAHLSANPEQKLLGQLVCHIFDAMKLAGEAGSLLKIEKEIASAVAEAKQKWLAGPKLKQGTLFARPEQQDLGFEVQGITDEAFWERAEENIYEALLKYAEQAENGGTYKRRLFAADAARGFAFIDVCRKRYDQIVMNPPFGDASKGSKGYIDFEYPLSRGNLLANFFEVASMRLTDGGMAGAIVSRTCFYLKTFTEFRQSVLSEQLNLFVFADLGLGVLEAMVETAASTWSKSRHRPAGNIFFRTLIETDKAEALKSAIVACERGQLNQSSFFIGRGQFLLLREVPFVYWINESVARLLAGIPTIDPAACSIRVGLQTGDDYRFLRLWSEIPPAEIISAVGAGSAEEARALCIDLASGAKTWAWYSKTEEASPFLASIHMCVNWHADGREIKSYHEGNGHSASKYVMSEDHYFRPGLSYMLRSVRLVPYAVPMGTIPTAGRSQVYPQAGLEEWLLILLASNVATCVSRFRAENFYGPKFQNTMVGSVPFLMQRDGLMNEGSTIVTNQRQTIAHALQSNESEILFVRPLDWGTAYQPRTIDRSSLLGSDFDQILGHAYGLDKKSFAMLTRDLKEAVSVPTIVEEDESSEALNVIKVSSPYPVVSPHVEYALGCIFGRWDIRFATGEKPAPELPDPFAPLSVCPPGQLQNTQGLPITREEVGRLKEKGLWNYPIEILWDGILIDDPGHPLDVEARVQEVLQVLWPDRWEAIEREACEILGVGSLSEYFRKPSGFFADHLKRYSKSRRQAPIYWPISSSGGSYTIWIYYHRLTDQTLHTALADFVDPKLKAVRSEIAALRESGNHRARLEELLDLAEELIDFRNEIERIIKLPWKPNLNDGVLMTASPLWKLFRMPKWQKDLKACWEKLEKGEYDWAHLAYSVWPTRVEEVCKTDRSIAIAHNLEHLCTNQPAKTKAKRGKKKAAQPDLDAMED